MSLIERGLNALAELEKRENDEKRARVKRELEKKSRELETELNRILDVAAKVTDGTYTVDGITFDLGDSGDWTLTAKSACPKCNFNIPTHISHLSDVGRHITALKHHTEQCVNEKQKKKAKSGGAE